MMVPATRQTDPYEVALRFSFADFDDTEENS